MNSYEIIKANIEFDKATRFGMCFENGRKNDFCWGAAKIGDFKPDEWQDGDTIFYTDEWHNIWHKKVGLSLCGEIYRPAIKKWTNLTNYTLPDLSNPEWFLTVKKLFHENRNKYCLGILPGFPFSISSKLRGFENYFKDMILERSGIEELHSRLAILLEKIMERYSKCGANGVFFCEDWGIQDRSFISLEMWIDIFGGLYRRLCSVAHDLGLDVFMHSCGYNWDLLDSFAGSGIDVFQFDQPRIYNIELLALKLKSLGVCLFSPVDIQKVLPSGNMELIQAEAKEMIDVFWRKTGGLIVKNYSDLPGIGVKPEWDQWAYKQFLQLCESPKQY